MFISISYVCVFGTIPSNGHTSLSTTLVNMYFIQDSTAPIRVEFLCPDSTTLLDGAMFAFHVVP